VGQNGDTSFPGFHSGLDSRGASVCFGARPTFFPLFSSPPFPPYTLVFRPTIDALPRPIHSFLSSFLQPGAAAASLGASLCFFATPSPLSSLFRSLVNSSPSLSQVRTTLFPALRLSFPFLFSIHLLWPGPFFVEIAEGAELILHLGYQLLALDPTRPGLCE